MYHKKNSSSPLIRPFPQKATPFIRPDFGYTKIANYHEIVPLK